MFETEASPMAMVSSRPSLCALADLAAGLTTLTVSRVVLRG
jgi:hypothetical protein